MVFESIYVIVFDLPASLFAAGIDVVDDFYVFPVDLICAVPAAGFSDEQEAAVVVDDFVPAFLSFVLHLEDVAFVDRCAFSVFAADGKTN